MSVPYLGDLRQVYGTSDYLLVEQAGLARIEIQKLKMGVMIDLRALLTPEQIEAVEAARAERREKRRAKRRARRGGPDADFE